MNRGFSPFTGASSPTRGPLAENNQCRETQDKPRKLNQHPPAEVLAFSTSDRRRCFVAWKRGSLQQAGTADPFFLAGGTVGETFNLSCRFSAREIHEFCTVESGTSNASDYPARLSDAGEQQRLWLFGGETGCSALVLRWFCQCIPTLKGHFIQ